MNGVDRRWWLADSDVHVAVFAWADHVREQQHARRLEDERGMRMYGQAHRIGSNRATHVYTPGKALLSLNVTRNMIDAVQAEICQNRPKATCLTRGGDWGLQRKAKRLEQFTDGLFYSASVSKTMPIVFKDCCTFGAGVAKVFCSDPKADKPIIDVERVMPFEILVDDDAGFYMNPRDMGQQKWVDRSELSDVYPDHKEAIKESTRTASSSDFSWDSDSESDRVLVVETWRKGAPGRHVIAIESATLLDEEWTESEFPFEFLRWSTMFAGFWGQSLATQLAGIQYEINKLLIEIQEAHHLLGKARVLWPSTSAIPKEYWNNQIGSIIPYNPAVGVPTVIAPQSVPSDVYAHLERLYAKAYEVTGISQLAAQSQKPAGLNSGKAIRIYADEQSKRFVMLNQQYDEAHKGLGRKMISTARALYADRPDYNVTWVGRKFGRSFAQTIPWKDVDMTEDQYVLQVFPTSSLPNTPAGRAQTVQEWANAGWIDRNAAMRLLEFPDIDNQMNLELASWDLITEMIERMLYAEDPSAPGAYQRPEPYMDLALGRTLAQGAYLRARLDGCPEDNCALLRNFMADCTFELDKAAKKAAELAAPPAMAPSQNAA